MIKDVVALGPVGASGQGRVGAFGRPVDFVFARANQTNPSYGANSTIGQDTQANEPAARASPTQPAVGKVDQRGM